MVYAMYIVTPVPAAKDAATSNASVALAIPDIKTPLIVSRIALVMARPGKRGIIHPTIVEL